MADATINAPGAKRVDSLLCGRLGCGHRLESHQPGEYGKDVCVALGYRKPFGGVCPCDGFMIRH